jgi:hypothetical protein
MKGAFPKRAFLRDFTGDWGLSPEEIEGIGHNALRLFPRTAERIGASAPEAVRLTAAV